MVSELAILAQKGTKIGPPKNCIYFFGYLQSSLLYIVGELAGEESVAVNIGVSDM